MKCRFWIYFLSIFINFWSISALSFDELQKITLKSGYEISLPDYPEDKILLDEFLTLTQEERNSFYTKRNYLIKRMITKLEKKGFKTFLQWAKKKALGINDSTLIEQQVEAAVQASVENMWMNAIGIAKSTGVGMTVSLGIIWNTTIGPIGTIKGRAISLDIGKDFSSNKKYINIFYDRQSKLKGGFSIDIGPMLDIMFNLTDPNVEPGEKMTFFNQKVPVLGSYRIGETYNGMGTSFGVHVLEVVAAVATVFGHPEVALAIIPAVRLAGVATVYKSSIERTTLAHFELSKGGHLGLNPIRLLSKFINRTIAKPALLDSIQNQCALYLN